MTGYTAVGKIEAMAGLVCIPGLAPSAVRVAIRLLHHFNTRTGRCDPSIRTLASATALADRSVYRAIQELEAKGLISVRSRGGKSGANSYQPKFAALRSWNPAPRQTTTKGENATSGTLTAGSQRSDISVRETLTLESGENKNKPINEQSRSRSNNHGPLRAAGQESRLARKRDPSAIDWNSWGRWLSSIGVEEPMVWLESGHTRAENAAGLSHNEACLLLDGVLRKARATWPSDRSLEFLLTEAIAKGRKSAPR